MRSILDELTSELEELKALVESISPVNQALARHHDSLVSNYVSVRRRFDDAAFAVALYASFEKFIESLVAAFAQLEARRLEYIALPEKLKTRHFSGTLEMLRRGRIGEGRYVGLTELDVVRNLFECLNGAKSYRLNEAAVVAHDQNLRAGEIDALFAAVGIEKICDLACRADAMVAWFCAEKGLEVPPQDGVQRTVIEGRLVDIVERRNQVAHRGVSPVNLLGPDDMAVEVGFVEALSRAIFSLVVGTYLKAHHAATAIQLRQREQDGPYKGGTIVVVEKPTCRLVVGQRVYVLVGTCARWGRIQSLKVDDAEFQAVDGGVAAENGIGVGLDFKCPKGAVLVALPVKDDVKDDLVWSPQPCFAPSG
ncbi:MAG: hypothetical protein IPK80_17380 [Nannocystis sp.]|nr:hypothetical protein [Nannocystis sp.]